MRKHSPSLPKKLRLPIGSLAVVAMTIAGCAFHGPSSVNGARLQEERAADVSAVSPALATYTSNVLMQGVWNRPGLSRRDRSIVTVAALISRNQPSEYAYYFTLALDNGVTPTELSEIITHLAFYSGWGNATEAAVVAKRVFDERSVDYSSMPGANVRLLPLNEAAEAKRATAVSNDFGAVSPGVVQITTDVVFKDLWQRPGLAPRDRSLVTVSALVAAGQFSPVGYHLNRAMENGLTQPEASEVLTQLAFYAGWPNVFSALPVFKQVFASRAH